MKITKKKIFLALFVILIIMQFFQIDKTNPPADPSKDFLVMNDAPDDIAVLMRTACYDCHSHEVNYPWYTSIAPLSFWIRGHIRGGRMHANYSTWAEYPEEEKQHLLQEMIEVVEQKEMPMLTYMIMHQDAFINDEQRATLAAWFKTRK